MATKGIAAPEVEQAYARARELCQQVGETPQLFPVLVGLFRSYMVRGELQTARELGKHCLSLAQRIQDPALLLEAHMALGPPSTALGEFVSAREHAERGIALYDLQQHRSHAFLYGLDPGMICLSIAAWALWVLGYPDQALKRSHEALTLARELSHPLSLAFALLFASLLRQLHREGRLALEQAEAVITLSTDQGFPQWLSMGTILRGWALAEQSQEEEGIAQLRQGIAANRAVGSGIQFTYYLALLAEAYGKVGQVEEGLSVLAEALAVVEKTGERWYEAELYRLKGTLTLQSQTSLGQVSNKSKASQGKSEVLDAQSPTSKAHAEVKACFLKAIEIARRQQAKSLELRATVSLAHLWQQQGKQTEAHQMLSEVYNWFTEGFDTKDLQEAKALLKELEEKAPI
jgi:predicted ATPase